MNISQALRKISTIKGELRSWGDRRKESLTWKDATKGDNYEVETLKFTKPAWSYKECAENLDVLFDELIKYEAVVAVANATTLIRYNGEDVSLAFAIRKLNAIKTQLAMLSLLDCLPSAEKLDSNTKTIRDDDRYVEVEMPYRLMCALPTREQTQIVDKAQKDFDELNLLVESANHNTNLAL